jgi:hypothetical protein
VREPGYHDLGFRIYRKVPFVFGPIDIYSTMGHLAALIDRTVGAGAARYRTVSESRSYSKHISSRCERASATTAASGG